MSSPLRYVVSFQQLFKAFAHSHFPWPLIPVEQYLVTVNMTNSFHLMVLRYIELFFNSIQGAFSVVAPQLWNALVEEVCLVPFNTRQIRYSPRHLDSTHGLVSGCSFWCSHLWGCSGHFLLSVHFCGWTLLVYLFCFDGFFYCMFWMLLRLSITSWPLLAVWSNT